MSGRAWGWGPLGLGVWLLLPASCQSGGAAFPVDPARAHARVVTQVEAGPRIPGSPGHATTRAWIESELERLGARVQVQRFVDSTRAAPLEVFNIIGSYAPHKAREDGHGPLVLAAHYDTRPWADEDPDSTRRREPVPGANDGASGVAVLLELAELLHRRAPPCAVDLVFFDAEDLGSRGSGDEFSIGSRGYAARLETPLPRAAFVFDMVGSRNLAIYPERTSVARASNIASLVLEGARATGARHFHTEPRYTVYDDHVPLLDRGVPAADIIDFDYDAWHTLADRPDQVSGESLAEVARVGAWLIYSSPLGRMR